MGSSGTGTQNQTTKTKSKTEPWEPTQDALKGVIGQAQSQLGNTGLNANEQAALDQLRANAASSPNYSQQGQQLTDDLFSGGQDRTGYVTSGYANYQQQAQPYLDPNYLNPYTNPAFKGYMDTLATDLRNDVRGQFAAAGRDFSGMDFQTQARGIAQGTSQAFANQYNQNVATQRGMMDNLYNAGNSTAGALSLLDQTALNNRMQGVNAASLLPGLQDTGANRSLAAEAYARGIPMQNLQNVSSLLVPIAGLGQQSSGVSNMSGSYTQPLSQTANQWTSAVKNVWPVAPLKIPGYA